MWRGQQRTSAAPAPAFRAKMATRVLQTLGNSLKHARSGLRVVGQVAVPVRSVRCSLRWTTRVEKCDLKRLILSPPFPPMTKSGMLGG